MWPRTSGFERTLALDFRPTAYTPVGDRHVLVAGRTDDGQTLIQCIELVVPRLVQDGNQRQLEPGPQTAASVETVYSGNEVGRDLVHVMFRNRGRPGTALVQFFDSKDWYELDWEREPFELRLAFEGWRHPELGDPWFDIFLAGEHRQLGYYYMLSGSAEQTTCLMMGRPSFVLLDLDRDGVIDEVAPSSRLAGPGQRELHFAEVLGVRYDAPLPDSRR